MSAQRLMICGVGVVVARDDRILLGARASGAGASLWSLPGGRLEYGETFEECGKRELHEETGLIAGARPRPVCVSNDLDGANGIQSVTVGLEMRGASGSPHNREPDRFVRWDWWSVADLPRDLFEPSLKILYCLFSDRVAWLAREIARRDLLASIYPISAGSGCGDAR